MQLAKTGPFSKPIAGAAGVEFGRAAGLHRVDFDSQPPTFHFLLFALVAHHSPTYLEVSRLRFGFVSQAGKGRLLFWREFRIEHEGGRDSATREPGDSLAHHDRRTPL